MIANTDATCQLGRFVMNKISLRHDPSQLIAFVRNPANAEDLKTKGVDIRIAGYSAPHTLDSAIAGVEKLLLISGNEVGK